MCGVRFWHTHVKLSGVQLDVFAIHNRHKLSQLLDASSNSILPLFVHIYLLARAVLS